MVKSNSILCGSCLRPDTAAADARLPTRLLYASCVPCIMTESKLISGKQSCKRAQHALTSGTYLRCQADILVYIQHYVSLVLQARADNPKSLCLVVPWC
jgi:hypothetical protein